jgi:peptidoglycan hydrolase-like protein with peptidoglycan-binding domain
MPTMRTILLIAGTAGLAVGVAAAVVARSDDPGPVACRTTQAVPSVHVTPVVVPSADGSQRRCLLKSGDGFQHSADQGQAALVLQQAIALCSPHDVGPIDGRFGPRTESALRQVQRDLGFAKDGQDGVYGPLTSSRMWFFTATGCEHPA